MAHGGLPAMMANPTFSAAPPAAGSHHHAPPAAPATPPAGPSIIMAQLQQRLQMQQQRQQQEADAAALLQGQHTFVDEGLLLPDELIPSSSMRMPHAPSPPLASAPKYVGPHAVPSAGANRRG